MTKRHQSTGMSEADTFAEAIIELFGPEPKP